MRPAARLRRALDPRPAAARGRPADDRARLRRRGLPRLRRPDAGAARPAVERGERPVPARARRRRRARQLADAAHAQRRRAAGPRRPGAQRPPRAPDRAGARVAARCSSSARRAIRRPARRRTSPAGRARWGTPTRASTSSSTPRSSTGSCTRGRRAARSGSRTRRRRGSPTASTASRSSRFWRWPTMRLNQVNWYALMYAADATVTGRPGLLRRDLRAQLARFVRGRNFGAGLRFQYLPHLAAYARSNLDSAEYANIVLSFLRFYNQARRAGMAPLSRAGRGLVRRWERRAIAGYWTHAGYLNWDTGLGFERWHQAKKLGLAQQALIGIAQTRSLQPGSEWGRWAKWMLDRGLRFYERLPVGEGGLPDPVLFKLFTVPQSVGSARLAAARLQANAARARRGRARAHARGRAAVAVRLRPRHRPPRGDHAGLQHRDRRGQPARLPLRRHRARAPVRRRPARRRERRRARARGVRAARARSRTVAASSPPRPGARAPTRRSRRCGSRARRAGPARPRATAPGGKVFAGPFHDLRARGTLTAGRFQAVTSHRFTPSTIETNWRLERRYGRARLRVDVLLPSWGAASARVVAVLRDGSRVSLRARRRAAALARRALRDHERRTAATRSCRCADRRAPSRACSCPHASRRTPIRVRRSRSRSRRARPGGELASPPGSPSLASGEEAPRGSACRAPARQRPCRPARSARTCSGPGSGSSRCGRRECPCPNGFPRSAAPYHRPIRSARRRRSSPPGCSTAASCSSPAAAPASAAPPRPSCAPAARRS